jgi:primary-amine oxidase
VSNDWLQISDGKLEHAWICSFVLSPLNFHDADVSLDSSNAVMLLQDEHTGKWSVDEYGVQKEHCAPLKRAPLSYGLETLYDLRGDIVDQDATSREPWLRESQFPHATDNFFHPPIKA